MTAFQSHNICYQLSRRERGDQASIEDFCLIKNIAEGNYTETIFKRHEIAISALDVQGYLAATASSCGSIKLWNVEKGKCLWTFKPWPNIQWAKFVKIIGGHIVCSGLTHTSASLRHINLIRIIDLNTGLETASITQSAFDKICTIGRQIFCYLNDGNDIGEWDLEGRLIRIIRSETNYGHRVLLLGSGNFLVNISNNYINIHHLREDSIKKIELKEGEEELDISSAHLDNGRLICGIRTYIEKDHPDCCVIDLETGEVINKYRASGAIIRTAIDDEPSLVGRGSVRKVITNKEWAYLGHTTGMVVAVNLAEKRHVVLGNHKNCIDHFATEGQILISGSAHTCTYPAELKFWDLKSLTKIAEFELPNLHSISFASGRVFAAVGRSLVQWDYLVSHKGKVMAKESASEI